MTGAASSMMALMIPMDTTPSPLRPASSIGSGAGGRLADNRRPERRRRVNGRFFRRVEGPFLARLRRAKDDRRDGAPLHRIGVAVGDEAPRGPGRGRTLAPPLDWTDVLEGRGG